ncbi:hypothetical protein [Hoeflea olei]|uniref:Uncharacterized protein n=1 Tax=Hoeflea olei TaxID=1480615 RepID=A0A1C1YS06_9HYPH|nr:hypothetical protein [Hoeflea olei]OCW56283.1 hypothetical protein AWJ14_19505 [Hoeflea olei]
MKTQPVQLANAGIVTFVIKNFLEATEAVIQSLMRADRIDGLVSHPTIAIYCAIEDGNELRSKIMFYDRTDDAAPEWAFAISIDDAIGRQVTVAECIGFLKSDEWINAVKTRELIKRLIKAARPIS